MYFRKHILNICGSYICGLSWIMSVCTFVQSFKQKSHSSEANQCIKASTNCACSNTVMISCMLTLSGAIVTIMGEHAVYNALDPVNYAALAQHMLCNYECLYSEVYFKMIFQLIQGYLCFLLPYFHSIFVHFLQCFIAGWLIYYLK